MLIILPQFYTRILTYEESCEAFIRLCEDSNFLSKLISNKAFIPTLLQKRVSPEGVDINCSPLYLLLEEPRGVHLFVKMCCNPKFRQELLKNDELISALLGLCKQAQKNSAEDGDDYPALYSLFA